MLYPDDRCPLALWEQTFDHLLDRLKSTIAPGEDFQLTLWAEDSQFIRFNRAKVRQGGRVQDGALSLSLWGGDRVAQYHLPFQGDLARDWLTLETALEDLRHQLPSLLPDPHGVRPQGTAHSHHHYPGQLLDPHHAATKILEPVADLDFAGLYAGGCCVRAQGDSAGQRHWFSTESFTLDYSCWTGEGQAVKGYYGDRSWDEDTYRSQIAAHRQNLTQLQRPALTLERGDYATYLAPAAVADLLDLAGSALAEMAFQRGDSPFLPLRRGEQRLSPHLTLGENFTLGLGPGFNEQGQLAPDRQVLIAGGELVSTLISSRTAQAYGLTSNGATAGESLRSPEILPGDLSEAQILPTLDRGLYVSNLHYLNWSDLPAGRITGMTRYGCFWVEGGEIVAPIAHLRFDDSLDRLWGSQLVALTEERLLIPETSTYGRRALGGAMVPGALLSEMRYTL
jgi:predicted Zn-dependent protease